MHIQMNLYEATIDTHGSIPICGCETIDMEIGFFAHIDYEIKNSIAVSMTVD